MKNSVFKKILKGVGLLFGIFLLVSFLLAEFSPSYESTMSERSENIKQWNSLKYEDRQKVLEDMIANKDFENESEVKQSLKKAVNDEFNSEAVFRIDPSPYNGFSNVVEADSGWINMTFKGSYRNGSNERKYFIGSAMLVYHPEDKTLSVKHWNVNDAKDE